DVVACTHGGALDRRMRDRVARNGVHVRTEHIMAIEHRDGGLSAIAFASGESIARDALFFATDQHPQSPLAIALGCSLTARGAVKTGLLSDTSVERVYVAGDASRDAQFAIVAAAAGGEAAVGLTRALKDEELLS